MPRQSFEPRGGLVSLLILAAVTILTAGECVKVAESDAGGHFFSQIVAAPSAGV